MPMGKDAKLYRDSATRIAWVTSGPATLVEITSVRDLTLPGERHVGDTSMRGDDHDSGDVGAISSKEISFNLAHRDTDTSRDALRTAFEGRATIPLAILNGARTTVGSRGLWADWKVSKFEEVQTLTGAIEYNVTVVKFATLVPSAWVIAS
ncbi:hypothetical protein LCGC14_2151320 [marine sediment metagenome]|uniref:Uncharacterized protein n=1 Tax=marine sediment metagenome TaxID=412755 RepID=A0A0F9DVM1_9ZZZZ